MKRIFLFLAVAALGTLSSCQGDEGPQGPQGPEGPTNTVFEILNANFTNGTDGYRIYNTFANTPLGGNLYDGETILIYRLSGTIDSQTPIWQLIPRTLYLTDGNELDYDFDFSKEDFAIYAGGTYDVGTTPEYITNQTFRVVVLTGNLTNRNSAVAGVDFNDYNAVIKAFNIDESKIKIIK